MSQLRLYLHQLWTGHRGVSGYYYKNDEDEHGHVCYYCAACGETYE